MARWGRPRPGGPARIGVSAPPAPSPAARVCARYRAQGSVWLESKHAALASGPSLHEALMLTLTLDTARRFILGKQGLWPGRRWRGSAGTAQAMHAMEYLQLDPLQVLACSQDITLHSR